jgi:hypothetical protein
LWGRMVSCAAIGNRRSSGADTGSRQADYQSAAGWQPAPQVPSADKILPLCFIETIY